MATTTNYGWTTPDDTALVKDGAAAIRTLGTSIDTTTKNLNPSTTLGDIEYRSSTANTNTRLAIGSTGQILTVAGGVPSWANPAGGGGFTSLASGSLPSATSLNLTSISGDYKDLRLVCRNLQQSSDNEITIRLNSSGVGYSWVGAYWDGAAFQGGGAGAQSKIYGTADNMEAGQSSTLQITIFDYANTSAYKTMEVRMTFEESNTATFETVFNSGCWRNTSAVNEINVFAPGTFSAGTYELFGIK